MKINKVELQLWVLDNLIWVIVLGFLLINAVFTPMFLTYGNIVNILYHSSILSLLVLAQGIVLITRRLDISLESTLAFAPAIALLLSTQWLPFNLDQYTVVVAILLVGGLVGYFNGFMISKIGINPLLQTIAMLILLRGLVKYLIPSPFYPVPNTISYLGQARTFGNIPLVVILVIIIYILFHFLLQKTPFGRRFVATGGNERASYVMGINTDKMIILAFVIAGVLAAIAGIIAVGRQGAMNNNVGDGMVLLSFAGAILGGVALEGGKGTALGMFGGALLLGMFSNSLNLIGVNVQLMYASKGALILVAIVIERMKVRLRNNILHKEQMQKLLYTRESEIASEGCDV